MEFYTRYHRPEKVYEKGGGELVTEVAGYIPAEVQITEMINAGIRLGEYRKEKYDFASEEDVDEDFFDVTRSPGFDLAEASINARIGAEAIASAKEFVQAQLDEKKVPEKTENSGEAK